MRLTKSDKQTFVDSVMNDVPSVDYNEQARKLCIEWAKTFEEFIKNGFHGESATLGDYELQANLYFPEVRLRNFIEIRNHDCVGGNLKYGN